MYSPHTALDAAPGGTNCTLATQLGLTGAAPTRPPPPVTERGGGVIGVPCQDRISMARGYVVTTSLSALSTTSDLVRKPLGIKP